jgi:hypothetical protein
MMAMMQFGPAQNPLLTRVTAEHIDKLLDHQDRELTLSYTDRQRARLVRGLILARNNHETLLSQLIPLAVTGIGGFTGGYGYSEIRHSRE